MIDRRPARRHRHETRRIGSRWLAGASLAILLVGACSAPTPPPPRTENPRSDSPTVSSSPAGSSSAAPVAGQTETDWGRIWDGLPEAFPVYPGATPADDAATEVVSATFVLDGVDARAVATWMQTELERGGYRTEALNGPLEDGSFVLDLVGDGDCRIQVAAAALGGLTSVTVRYGAACPDP